MVRQGKFERLQISYRFWFKFRWFWDHAQRNTNLKVFASIDWQAIIKLRTGRGGEYLISASSKERNVISLNHQSRIPFSFSSMSVVQQLLKWSFFYIWNSPECLGGHFVLFHMCFQVVFKIEQDNPIAVTGTIR